MRRTEAILPQSDIARRSPCVAILASGERGRQPFAKKTLANSEGKMADQPPLSQRSSHQKQQPIGSLSTVVKTKRTQTILNHTHTTEVSSDCAILCCNTCPPKSQTMRARRRCQTSRTQKKALCTASWLKITHPRFEAAHHGTHD